MLLHELRAGLQHLGHWGCAGRREPSEGPCVREMGASGEGGGESGGRAHGMKTRLKDSCRPSAPASQALCRLCPPGPEPQRKRHSPRRGASLPLYAACSPEPVLPSGTDISFSIITCCYSQIFKGAAAIRVEGDSGCKLALKVHLHDTLHKRWER